MLQFLAYIGVLFVCFGSWAIPGRFISKALGLWVMLAIDGALIWFWFRYGFG